MPSFGAHSEQQLGLCDPRLVAVLRRAIQIVDFRVSESHRSAERQLSAFVSGASQLPPGHSKHERIPAEAVDCDPWPLDWKKKERYYFLAGVVFTCADGLGVKIRWGGDWDRDLDFYDQRLFDLRHFELVRV